MKKNWSFFVWAYWQATLYNWSQSEIAKTKSTSFTVGLYQQIM